MADRHRMNIVHTETVDGRHVLAVLGTPVPAEVRQQAFFYPRPTRWEIIRSLPRFALARAGLANVRTGK